jgi:hypothetical protein
MKTKLIFIIIVMIVLIACSIFGYILFTKQRQQEQKLIETKDIYVDAVDKLTNERLTVNYSLMINGSLYTTGTLRNDSISKIKVLKSYTLYEFYLNDPKYYTDMNAVVGDRLTIDAYQIGTIIVYTNDTLRPGDNNVRVYVNTSYQNREVSFCLAWSTNIVYVKNNQYRQYKEFNTEIDCEASGYTWIPETVECGLACKLNFKAKNITAAKCSVQKSNDLPPSFFAKNNVRTDTCYYVKKTITTDDNLVLDLNYKAYPGLNTNDFIKLYVIDSNNNIHNKYVLEDENGNDVGAQTNGYIIK